MKKRNKLIKYLIGIFVLLVILYTIFIIIATAINFPLNKILDNEPIYYFACAINPLTIIEKSGCWECSDEQDYTFEWLKEWGGYHGCNESTRGYNGKGQICGLTSCGVIRLT